MECQSVYDEAEESIGYEATDILHVISMLFVDIVINMKHQSLLIIFIPRLLLLNV